MTSVVLDTNVLISGTFWSGASFQVLKLVYEGKLGLVLSPEIIEEYLRVIEYAEIIEKTTEEQRNSARLAVQKMISHALIVTPTKHFQVVKADPLDDKFIDAAVEANVAFIISQDRHLLDVKEFSQIKIISPKELLCVV